MSDEQKEVLFGKETVSTEKQDSGAAGYLIFNDAWWMPEGNAFAPEMITVHAQQYYNNRGKDAPHPDFESPNPNPQIAIQDSFLFSVEGDAKWAEYGIMLLERVMKERGVGAKGAAGYGYFSKNEKENQKKIKSFKVDQDDFEIKLKAMQKEADFDALSKNQKVIKVFEDHLNKIQKLPMPIKLLNSLDIEKY